MYELRRRAEEKDPSGYYNPRWDEAESIKVKAETKKEAFCKAEVVLGDAERGWPWAMTVDDMQEL